MNYGLELHVIQTGIQTLPWTTVSSCMEYSLKLHDLGVKFYGFTVRSDSTGFSTIPAEGWNST